MGVKKSDLQTEFESFVGEEWMPLEDLFREFLQKVPPGKALRRFQIISRTNLGPSKLTIDDQLNSGSRSIIRDWYHSPSFKSSTEEEVRDDGVRYIRKVPGGESVPFVLPFSRNLTQRTVTLPSKRSLRRLCLTPLQQRMTG